MPRGRPRKTEISTPITDDAMIDNGARAIVVTASIDGEPSVPIAELLPNPPCVVCGMHMLPNTPERWVNEPDNNPSRWWNTMDFYCPNCHTFQNVGDYEAHRYVRGGKMLSASKNIVTLIPPKKESAIEPTHD